MSSGKGYGWASYSIGWYQETTDSSNALEIMEATKALAIVMNECLEEIWMGFVQIEDGTLHSLQNL